MANNKKQYRVTWIIELDAYNELDAAQLALEIQRDSGSEALNFEVTELGAGNLVHVDLNG
jgi:hypothetical protein